MLTGIEATIQESEPLMIQQASVNCADQMQSTGFTLVLSESMSTADSEEPGSLTHDRREPSEEPASLTHDRREPSEEPASLTHESMSTADSEEPGSLTHDRREPSEEPASLSHDRRKPSEEPASLTHESMSTADSEEPGSLTHDRREPSEEPASLTHDRREPSEEPASLTHESMSTADSEEPGSLTHDRREPSEEPASLTHDRREPSEEPASLTHESMSTADSEEPGSVTHDRREPSEEPASLSHDRREPNPQVPHRDVYERFAEIFLESILAQGLAGASRHVHDRESSTATGIEEVTVEDCQSPDVLHESESLKSQPASMESGGLSPVYPQYKPTEAYKEIEPVSSSDGFNLSNQEDSDCDSDDDPAYIPDTDSDDTEPESSGTQHTTRKSVVKFGSALSTADSDCDSDDDPAYIPDTDSDDTEPESSGTQHTTRKSVVKFGSALSTADVGKAIAILDEDSDGDMEVSSSEDKVPNTHSTVHSQKDKGVYLQSKKLPRDGCQKRYDKINFCVYCKKAVKSKISRHLLTHKERQKVLQIRLLPKKSKQRENLFTELVNEGNFKHNIDVISTGEGVLITARRENIDQEKHHSHQDYVPCVYCKGFYLKKLLWHHLLSCKMRPNDTKGDNMTDTKNAVRKAKSLLYGCLHTENEKAVAEMLRTMHDDDIKEVVKKDTIIKLFSSMQVCALGGKHIQKKNDMHRISQNARTLARLVIKASEHLPMVSLNKLLCKDNFDLVVNSTLSLSHNSVTVANKMGHLLGHCIMIKNGYSVRRNSNEMAEETRLFKVLFDAEWKYRVNAPMTRQKTVRDMNKLTCIPETDDLVKFRDYIKQIIENEVRVLRACPNPGSWTRLAKATMCRLYIFNKRRIAEVEDMLLEAYQNRPEWTGTEEFRASLSDTEREFAKRMDMLEVRGKSKKNVTACILLTPDVKSAINVLVETRSSSLVSVPRDNPYLFSRLNALTPLSGSRAMHELVRECPGLQRPERITTTLLRKYIATVSQILDMTHGELKLLAKHLGHDVKTHKEYYQLSSSTMELSKVALMLYAVENGKVNEWKGRQMKDIVVEDLPLPIEDEDGHQEESMSTADSEEPGSLTHDRREPSEEPASLTHDRREPSEEPASLTHESMSTAASEGPASLTHDEMRQPNPQGTGTRKGMKRKWASEENICFMNFFRDELREKIMPSGSKIMGSLKILTGRTVAQIRARVHNIIMKKQKWKKNC
ncbi:uncharacterized protein LOC127867138 isoform X19 [Dreissena polymorpha]|uniref:uncharacterized protein LOC127867138 isoform X16 n=1 Tax=Dreissena polymorpha TaxID=45954 RepID=UPI002263F111|nr:uncharacterized protein LOC127867138 isoform X16 [Dreissena polymorpha]XP_052264133.1 uncharacterized protein LOC127867138 isoform X17 [Dreissena polymorpha]XP_052264134.1 uncharacterized protein LOC127867138 isoform X18 [Dreissena polymorpha]XP_052264135.1 uncharacterized protein LOC127867138 isoform X19 [Dreissena polymorpha]